MKRTSQKAPTADDKLVGQSVRQHRLAAGMSQERLGAAIGVTFQQVQKYENGANRISTGRLQQIANALGVDVPTLIGHSSSGKQKGSGRAGGSAPFSREEFDLIRSFRLIENSAVSGRLRALVRAVAESTQSSPTSQEQD